MWGGWWWRGGEEARSTPIEEERGVKGASGGLGLVIRSRALGRNVCLCVSLCACVRACEVLDREEKGWTRKPQWGKSMVKPAAVPKRKAQGARGARASCQVGR